MTIFRFILFLTGFILIAEIAIVSFLSILRPLPLTEEIFFSTSVFVLIAGPIIYYKFIKPLQDSQNELRRLDNKLMSLSLTDELTGLHSQHGFFTLAKHQVALAKRQNMTPYLFKIKIDNLQEIIKTCGSKEEEVALFHFANILKSTYRKSDLIARLNRNKFAVYPAIATYDDKKSSIMRDRLQKNIAEHNAHTRKNYALSFQMDIRTFDSDFDLYNYLNTV